MLMASPNPNPESSAARQMLAHASKYQISPTNSNRPNGIAAGRSEPTTLSSTPKGYSTNSASTATPNNAMPVCRNRWPCRAMASTTQANASGKPTLKTTRVKIRSLGFGGSSAPSTSSNATAAATSPNKNSDAGN